MSLREDYDVPASTGRLPAIRMWIVMLAVPAAALLAWVVLPDSPVTVAILAVAVLAAVFTAVHWVLSARGLNRPPARDPRPRT
jgi:membrane protein implicated in regulation of membrane protease activity